ncbi:MAG: 16S rRNA (cytosine(1402)-N(4))-methyltransferase RsmH [Actinomyces sp.]|jgi:16S rRNA (cytosine1402-N4)-methyltransferase|nr:16S rRNA (cytosine(1402)-N(4))-methyltransferase RsmH [Actinomyces sp.]MCI1641264.1 16S rRNA (cytosine(1402)-N(4))-methyltransferase RsmH [Actinomyces sp.]MCI1662083.1 16S rRNA (cytosine(1402)-N(4))-methyltransferase RsmH [Actinomyces sp.]MCI1786885.1 16S rRNA (cytosine(1402)-N(4))-methyltransferase RsmH [Actinomyces sp.]MCI1828973.1 16S rRNA (cytosine(1402)-N(4))-methyltransferase RsmH [Actinomyces sp.]MCI1866822.1 16S rRNA (cytosine(1402)-N(4))-methyltransferase RsmH [Actinomyces sp.]
MGAERTARDLHVPVLLEECLDLLAPALASSDAVLVDATLGMGGHAEGALRRFPGLRVVGIDRDPEAISLASRRLAPFGERFAAVRTTYDHVDEVAAAHGREGLVDGVLMDLGVSSLQLDEAERGFSYSHDAPLDMRMDPTGGPSAADLLASADERELTRILRDYGEERFAQRIARAIVSERRERPLTRTSQLADLVRGSIPAPARRTGGNPSKRTFQALRVAVNDELRLLEDALPRALAHVRVGGRVVVESYQSLEDRIVKTVFRQGSEDRAPAGLPIVPAGLEPPLRLLTRGAARADERELARNPRSASVRLRAVEVVSPWRSRP